MKLEYILAIGSIITTAVDIAYRVLRLLYERRKVRLMEEEHWNLLSEKPKSS